MLHALLVVGGTVGCAALAVVLLAARDDRNRRLQAEQRPVAERIADVSDDAQFMVSELQRVLDRNVGQRVEGVAWIPNVLTFYRRLETLASSQTASPDEALRLAEEASRYVREQRLKGIIVGEQARHLAALQRKRDSALTRGSS